MDQMHVDLASLIFDILQGDGSLAYSSDRLLDTTPGVER
jgi:hypothetical protein